MKEQKVFMRGKASISFPEPVFIKSCASIVGKKEGEGPLGPFFDRVEQDPLFGADTWEAGESAMQKEAALLALKKAGLKPQDLRMIFAGDLLAQTSATSFGSAGLKVPFYGLFGACSTMGEALSLGAITLSGGFGDPVLCTASSHFASAEKEFRFPLGYGSQRPLSATWTVTGCGAFVLASQPPKEQSSQLKSPKGCTAITGITTGQLVDFGLKDSLNMGACMAPAACHTICQNLQDFGLQPSDYDAIITGDLGVVGQRILFDLMREKDIDISNIHRDCGLIIFQNEKQDTHSGGSGCGCSAVVLGAHILPKISQGLWKRVLFLPTGALLSKTSFNEGDSIPGIAHGVVLEHVPF